MIINGKEFDFEGEITISDILKELGLTEDRVVVEVNLQIVPKSQYSQWILNEEDKIEIVSFVGGG